MAHAPNSNARTSPRRPVVWLVVLCASILVNSGALATYNGATVAATAGGGDMTAWQLLKEMREELHTLQRKVQGLEATCTPTQRSRKQAQDGECSAAFLSVFPTVALADRCCHPGRPVFPLRTA